MHYLYKILTLILIIISFNTYAEPKNFEDSKHYVKKVYQGNEKTFYCGCDYTYRGRTGGVINHKSCGYKIRSNGIPSEAVISRASRLEYEHVVPASWYGRQLQCWQNGGRENCKKTSTDFNIMESDIINLVPSIGQINGDRSNHKFGIITSKIEPQYGSCDFKVDFKNKIAQPKPEIRGEIARIMFYMYDAYGMRMSKQDSQLYIAWHNMYPVSDWEIEKNRRFKQLIKRENEFVSGKKVWTLDFKPSGFMINGKVQESEIIITDDEEYNDTEIKEEIFEVRGNKNSKIYHLPHCPNYEFNPANRVTFESEELAINAGYRKAGNCK